MRDLVSDIRRWRKAGQTVAVATVVKTWGSSPRPPGAGMAVSDSGEVAGSVSGGCVEGAVIEAALEVLRSGSPRRLHFGVADETAWEVGLACGGEIEVFVQPLDEQVFETQSELVAANQPHVTLHRIDTTGPQSAGAVIFLGKNDVRAFRQETLTLSLLDKAGEALEAGMPAVIETGSGEFFANVHMPAPTIVVVGGVQITLALVDIAQTLGYRTVVVDPRRAFGNALRFPQVDRLIQEWPEDALSGLALDPSTAVAVVTHDPKLDDPALEIALRSKAFYVGALGSRKTQAQRRARLHEAGLTADQLDRLRGPIGLDLGGRSPEEIALAIMAEIVQARNRVPR